ncbi:MAG: hypothetical protein AB1429_01240 [Pseudomonadota bacterium]
MQRALILALIALSFLVRAPFAAAEDKNKPPEHYIDLFPVALPLVKDGKIVNYVFVSTRLQLAPSVDSSTFREKEPYFRDALVRAGNRTPFTKPGDYLHVDEAALKASLMRSAASLSKPGEVIRVDVVTQTPKQTQGLPK